MKGTQGAKARPGTFQGKIRANDIDNVVRLGDPLDGFLGDQSHGRRLVGDAGDSRHWADFATGPSLHAAAFRGSGVLMIGRKNGSPTTSSKAATSLSALSNSLRTVGPQVSTSSAVAEESSASG